MKIELVKFGDVLISRPDGREAYLVLLANQLKDLLPSEPIELDFKGVKVLAPSWADEVITKIASSYDVVKLVNIESNVINAALDTLRKYSDLKI